MVLFLHSNTCHLNAIVLHIAPRFSLALFPEIARRALCTQVPSVFRVLSQRCYSVEGWFGAALLSPSVAGHTVVAQQEGIYNLLTLAALAQKHAQAHLKD